MTVRRLGLSDEKKKAREKRQATMMERYGQLSWNKEKKASDIQRAKQSESAKRRWKQGFRNGESTQFKKGLIPWSKRRDKNDPRIKQQIEKWKKTMLLRYGPNASGNGVISGSLEAKEWAEGMKARRMAKYGKPYWNQGLTVEDPRVKLNHEKRDKTMLERYNRLGPPTIWNKGLTKSDERIVQQDKKRQTTMLKRYGRVGHVMYTQWHSIGGREKMLRQLSKMPSKRTGIEILAQESLNKRSVQFIANSSIDDICNADLVLTDYKVAIFCDGCYWHGCNLCGHNNQKSMKSREKDIRQTALLISKDWVVLRFWEHEFKPNPDIVGVELDKYLLMLKEGLRVSTKRLH